MNKENSNLLLKDLSARLPYKVMCHFRYSSGEPCYGELTAQDLQWFQKLKINAIKPYLRPLSSMTEEEKKEFELLGWRVDELADNEPWAHCGSIEHVMAGINWLLAHHFDFNGLIPLGLAIEVTEENNPYKQ